MCFSMERSLSKVISRDLAVNDVWGAIQGSEKRKPVFDNGNGGRWRDK